MMMQVEKSSDPNRVHAFIQRNHERFRPPLSSRVDVVEYANKLAACAENWFVTDGQADLGHAAMYANDNEQRRAFISSIAVAEEHGGAGLGHALLLECIRHARDSDMLSIELDVAIVNQRARAFYKKHGFRPDMENNEGQMRMRFDLRRDGSDSAI